MLGTNKQLDRFRYHPMLATIAEAQREHSGVKSDHVSFLTHIKLPSVREPLCLLSWNVLQADADCGYAPAKVLTCGETAAQREVRHQEIALALARMVAIYQPDFIALQEILVNGDNALYTRIQQQLPGYACGVVNSDIIIGDYIDGYGCVTLYNREKFSHLPDPTARTAAKYKYHALKGTKTVYQRCDQTVDPSKYCIINVHAQANEITTTHELRVIAALNLADQAMCVIAIGDYNCMLIAPQDLVPRKIVTNVVPAQLRPEGRQGASAIDGCFFSYYCLEKQAIMYYQAVTHHLNPQTGYVYTLEELALNEEEQTDFQRCETNTYRMLMCVDQYYQTEQLINQAFTLFEYEAHLQQELNDKKIVVRAARNLNNQTALSVLINQEMADFFNRVNHNELILKQLEDKLQGGIYPVIFVSMSNHWLLTIYLEIFIRMKNQGQGAAYALAISFKDQFINNLFSQGVNDMHLVLNFKTLKKSSGRGNKKDCYLLARSYELGLGTPIDLSQAEYYYQQALLNEPLEEWERAALQGNQEMQFIAGCVYRRGHPSVPQNLGKAYSYFQLAAKEGHVGAVFELAQMYDQGLGVNGSLYQAQTYYEQAATIGDARAQFYWGLFLKDYKIKILPEQATSAMIEDAQFYLSYTEEEKLTYCVKTPANEIIMHVTISPASLGEDYTGVCLAVIERDLSKISEQTKNMLLQIARFNQHTHLVRPCTYIERAANSGYCPAQYFLAMERSSPSSCAIALKQQYPHITMTMIKQIAYQLFTQHYTGNGVPRDKLLANKYRQLALMDDTGAIAFRIGLFYQQQRHENKAAYYLTTAKTQGYIASTATSDLQNADTFPIQGGGNSEEKLRAEELTTQEIASVEEMYTTIEQYESTNSSSSSSMMANDDVVERWINLSQQPCKFADLYALETALLDREWPSLNDAGLVEMRARNILESIEYKHQAVVLLLAMALPQDLTIPGNDGFSFLHRLASSGQHELLKYLLDQNPSLVMTTVSIDGSTLLHSAAMGGNLPSCEYLLKNELSGNVLNSKLLTPLHNACMAGHLPIVNCLLKNKVWVNTKNKDGMTPLHFAVRNLHRHGLVALSIIASLLKNGADPLLRDGYDETVVDFITSRFAFMSGCDLYLMTAFPQGSLPKKYNNSYILTRLPIQTLYYVDVRGKSITVTVDEPYIFMSTLYIFMQNSHFQVLPDLPKAVELPENTNYIFIKKSKKFCHVDADGKITELVDPKIFEALNDNREHTIHLSGKQVKVLILSYAEHTDLNSLFLYAHHQTMPHMRRIRPFLDQTSNPENQGETLYATMTKEQACTYLNALRAEKQFIVPDAEATVEVPIVLEHYIEPVYTDEQIDRAIEFITWLYDKQAQPGRVIPRPAWLSLETNPANTTSTVSSDSSMASSRESACTR